MTHADPPLVTLFVMAWRQEATVRAAIEGAFAQTWPNLEILLSDDASPDGTFAAMEAMAAAYDGPHRVRLNRNPENLGITRHLSRIAELAEGALLVQNAGDDVSEPERVARLAAVWAAPETAGRVRAVHSSVTLTDVEGRVLGIRRPPAGVIASADLATIGVRGLNAIGASLAFERSLFERFGPIPAECGVEDGAICFRAALTGALAYVDAPLVRYRLGGLSDRSEDGPGRRAFYTDAIMGRRWVAANARANLAALEKAPEGAPPDLARQIRAAGDAADWQVRLAEGSPLARAAMLPEALGRAFRARSAAPLAMWAKYMLGRLFLAFYDARQPPEAFLAPVGHPDAKGEAWERAIAPALAAIAAREAAALAAAPRAPGLPADVVVPPAPEAPR